MPGNSQRRGAKRSTGSKKGATAGSGGQRRRGLEGRGPTPPADQRTGHPAARKAAAASRRDDARGRARKAAETTPELLVGRNPVVEALRARVPATALYVAHQTELDERVAESVRTAGDRGIAILEVGRPELDKLSSGAVHQGIGLAVPPFQYVHLDDLLAAAAQSGQPPLLVALDGVQDPRNLGAVVRSASAFGAHGVLIPQRRAAGVTATAWRASAGAAARMPIARVPNLTRALQALQEAGVVVAGLSADGDMSLYDLPDPADPLCVVVGSEGRGVSRLVGETCDLRVSIPMTTHQESLNASVAAAIALAEVARARRFSAAG